MSSFETSGPAWTDEATVNDLKDREADPDKEKSSQSHEDPYEEFDESCLKGL